MKNTENYFDTVPYNEKLIRNSSRPASNSIGPDEYINPEPGPSPVDRYTYFYVEDFNGGGDNVLFVSGKFSSRIVRFGSYSFEVSEDGVVWMPYSIDINNSSIEIHYNNNKIYIRSSVSTYCVLGKNNDGYKINITSTQPFNIGGNIMSLLYGKNFTGDETSFPQDSSSNVFSNLFKNDQNLRDSSNLILPAETLLPYCYSSMFSGSSITAPPKTLPATTLTDGCYHSMFYGCRFLTQSPEILATSFGLYCCVEMFRESRVNEITTWINYKWDQSATQDWLADASPEGSFYNLGNVNLPRDFSGCPQDWTLYTKKGN